MGGNGGCGPLAEVCNWVMMLYVCSLFPSFFPSILLPFCRARDITSHPIRVFAVSALSVIESWRSVCTAPLPPPPTLSQNPQWYCLTYTLICTHVLSKMTLLSRSLGSHCFVIEMVFACMHCWSCLRELKEALSGFFLPNSCLVFSDSGKEGKWSENAEEERRHVWQPR